MTNTDLERKAIATRSETSSLIDELMNEIECLEAEKTAQERLILKLETANMALVAAFENLQPKGE